ncbi:unnamed protein product [Oppiella nova]|uniref:NADP-dependent oxidoreductase domain-containing protein n=1 Tax=Oppiella nova TaxID=334625 RepID=A0A7R9MEQ0_9ACAR|nr:unnamed protein product [Oppiella nova]CAG2175016.1 unnamed protein product [Oppiella nova]
MIELGHLKRQDFWISIKVWNSFHSRELVHKQTKTSLKNLGLDYIDLLLMHYPTGYAFTESNHKLWFPTYRPFRKRLTIRALTLIRTIRFMNPIDPSIAVHNEYDYCTLTKLRRFDTGTFEKF